MARGRHLLPALSQTEQEKFDAPQTRRVTQQCRMDQGQQLSVGSSHFSMQNASVRHYSSSTAEGFMGLGSATLLSNLPRATR